jgi:hypothetical protein
MAQTVVEQLAQGYTCKYTNMIPFSELRRDSNLLSHEEKSNRISAGHFFYLLRIIVISYLPIGFYNFPMIVQCYLVPRFQEAKEFDTAHFNILI